MTASDVTIAPSSSEEGVGGGEITRATLLKRAAKLRSNPTEPEKRLWRALQSAQLKGSKFRRQAVIAGHIVDFFCPAKGLIVEVDGDTHDSTTDLRRDAAIERQFGYKTVRFTNEDVMQNLEGVLIALSVALEQQPDRWPARIKHHPPTPSSEEEGG